MKTKSLLTLGFIIILYSALCPPAFAQGTAFTYQGRLTENGGLSSGSNDFTFTLYDAASGGATVGVSNVVNDLAVTNGLFTTALDFGAAAFSGSDRWLEIGVRPGTNTSAYTPLTPRQRITSAPYAIRAANLTGTVPLSQLPAGVVTNNSGGVLLAGAFTGNGAGLSNVNAATLGGLGSAGFWKTNGNAGADPANGAFLGTTDNLPVELKVNGSRTLRLEPLAPGVISSISAPNVIGGWEGNQVVNGAIGATVWGGGFDLFGDYGNIVAADFGTVSGGRQNMAGGAESTVAGGRANSASGGNATIGGGYANTVPGEHATVAGGRANAGRSLAATIGGGAVNYIEPGADYATIAGGYDNDVLDSATYSTVGGGTDNMIYPSAVIATIGGGGNNSIGSNALRGTVAGGFANTVGAPEGTVAGGGFNSALGFSSAIGGGGGNTVSGGWSTIAGGRDNVLTNSDYAAIGGGVQNSIRTNAPYSTIGGGLVNTVGAQEGTVAGGAFNSVLGFSATIGGGGGNTASGDWSTIAGGRDNQLASTLYATIGGGDQNVIQSNAANSTIGGGVQNTIASNAFNATIGGGAVNTVGAPEGTVAGGAFNSALGFSANIGGGGGNTASGDWSTIAGGRDNALNTAPYATIGGGVQNTIQSNGFGATIPGGWLNSATNFAFAAGYRAKADHSGAFVWADSTDADFASTRTNQFNVRATGGARLETGGAGMTLDGLNVLSGIVPSASLAGTYGSAVTLNNAANSFSGNGASLTALNASQLTGGTVPAAALGNAWKIGGNAGTTPGTHFLGTTDNLPLEFRVNGQRTLRLEPDLTSPNILAGSPANAKVGGIVGAAVLGGGNATYPNIVANNYATVVGGISNTASGNASLVMGQFNTASGYAAVASGYGSTAGGFTSFAAGNSARAAHDGSFVWGDNTFANFASTANNQFLIRANGGVGINTNNPNGAALAVNGNVTVNGIIGRPGNQALEFTVNNQRGLRLEPTAGAPNVIGGSSVNTVGAGAEGATIAGGVGNQILGNSSRATIAGGSLNEIGANSFYSAIGGGVGNTITANAESATIPGGRANTATNYAFAAGYHAKAFHTGAFVWADYTGADFASTANNQFLIRASGGVGLGTPNPQTALHVYSASSPTTIRVQSAGGFGAGRIEFLSDPQGSGNEWRPGYIQSTDNGGFTGGLSFVVNGTGFGNFFTEVETMRIMNGRVGIGTNNPQSALHVVGTVTATTFNPPSDRNLKENFSPVSPREVLEKVTALPISRWNFKGDAATPHVGPMAQDFYAAFGTGTDERHIATVDADGVALAAIQGLNEKLEVRSQRAEGSIRKLNAELKAKDARIAELEKRLAAIEALLQK